MNNLDCLNIHHTKSSMDSNEFLTYEHMNKMIERKRKKELIKDMIDVSMAVMLLPFGLLMAYIIGLFCSFFK